MPQKASLRRAGFLPHVVVAEMRDVVKNVISTKTTTFRAMLSHAGI